MKIIRNNLCIIPFRQISMKVVQCMLSYDDTYQMKKKKKQIKDLNIKKNACESVHLKGVKNNFQQCFS